MSDKEIAPMDQKSDSSHVTARRSFLRKSAIAAPVILSVKGKPAWGSTIVCSGSVSGNVSQHGEGTQSGCSQGRWKKISQTGTKPGGAFPNSWPSGAYVGGKPFTIDQPFVNIFGREPSLGAGSTLGQVGADNPPGGDRKRKMEGFAIAYCLNWLTFAPIIISQGGSLGNYKWPSIEAMIVDYQTAVDALPDIGLINAMITYLEDSWRNHI